MADAESLITEHIAIWTSAIKKRSATGRGSKKTIELAGIKKLRELILELAFSGKLLTQSCLVEDYESLLEEIKSEREQYHEKKGVRLQKFKQIVGDNFELKHPKSWKTVFFDQVITYITDFQANGSFSSLKKNVTYYDTPNYAILVRLTDLRHRLSNNTNYKYTDEVGYNFLAKSSIEGEELVVANVGAGVGTTLLIPKINMPATLAPNMFMVVLSKYIDKKYFLYYSKSPAYLRYISLVNTGTGQPKINKTEYKNCKFPLPPLTEQHRIVTKVDELMALCDQLEQQTEDSITAHQTLVETLLATLSNSESPAAFNQNWTRIAEHFDTLFTTEHSIGQLKQTILQLAVMGKLVPQNPNNEPASVLLKKIAAEKAQLIKDKKIKKQRPLPAITEDEKSFKLPSGWEWSNLGNITIIRGGKRLPKGQRLTTAPTPYIYIRVSDMKQGTISDNDLHYISEDIRNQISNYIITKNDIYMTIVGATIGKCGLVPSKFDGMNLTENAARLVPYSGIDKTFLFKYLDSSFAQSQFFDKTKK